MHIDIAMHIILASSLNFLLPPQCCLAWLFLDSGILTYALDHLAGRAGVWEELREEWLQDHVKERNVRLPLAQE